MVRINEILENQIDKEIIESRFRAYFEFKNGFEISDKGEVNVKGDCTLAQSCVKFPVKFGYIHGYFRANRGDLRTLEGSPYFVKGAVVLSNNELTTLEHCPGHITGNLVVTDNPFKTLEGIPPDIEGDVFINWNTPLPMLRLLQYKGLAIYRHSSIDEIMEKYTNDKPGTLRQRMTACAKELRSAGLEKNARW